MAGSTRNPWEENYSTEGDSASGANPWEQSYQEPEKPKPRNLAAVANDTAIEVANAAAGGLSAAANFVKPGNAVSGWIDKNIVKAGEDAQSDVTKAAKQQFRQDVESADGVMGELGAVGRYVVENPLLSAAQAAGSFVGPGVAVKAAGFAGKAAQLGAKGVERAGRAGGVAAGAAMAGGDAAGTAYELSSKAGATEDQAVAAGRQASVIPAVIGGVGGMFGAEKLLAGAKGFAGGATSRALKTGASEAVQEGIEEGATQYEGQRAAMPYDPSIDPSKGVAAAAGMGAALGGITGAGASLLTGRDTGQQPNPGTQTPPGQTQPAPDVGPALALPAPDRGVIQVGQDGTARTPTYQAPDYVGDVTDVEAKTPRAQAADFASILDTDNVYSGWSNVQDGSDRATMRDQMDYVGRTYGGKTTPENAAEVAADLHQQFKWFRAASPEQKRTAINALMAPAAPIDPVREQVAAVAEQGGALSGAALTAIDSGASSAMQPVAPDAAPPAPISLEEADARDQAAYEQFYASYDSDPVVGRYFEDDNDIPDFDAASNASDEDFLRSLGATDEYIQDAIATSRQPTISQSGPAVDAGAQANEPAGTRQGAGTDAAGQEGQVAPRQPGNFTGTPTATMGQQGATARPGPGFGLKDALAQIRTKKQQEAANAKAATSEAAPAAQAVPAAGTGAVEAAGLNQPKSTRKAAEFDARKAAEIEAGALGAQEAEAAGVPTQVTWLAHRKWVYSQAPRMTLREFQVALKGRHGMSGPEIEAYYKSSNGGAEVSAAKITTEGTANVPQADQAQQTATQPTQAGAAQPTQGLTDAATDQNTGAQTAPAPDAQGTAPAESAEQRTQRVAQAGEAWTRMPAAQREALAGIAAGLNPIQRKRVPSAAWADLNRTIQRNLADAMGGREEYGGNSTGTSVDAAPAAINSETSQDEKARWLKSVADMNRMSGQFGAQIDGVTNGRLSVVGNPNATKQGRALMAAVDEARRAGATNEEIAQAAAGRATAAPQGIAPAPAQETTYNGTRIYPTKVKVGDEVKSMWAAESPDNQRRRAAGERAIGGDSLHDTLEQAKAAAEREAKRDAEQQAAKAEQDAADKARLDAEEARKAANRPKTVVERRKDAILDGPSKIGQGTKRAVITSAVDNGYAIEANMVYDYAAKKRDQETVDRASRAGYILGVSNENLPLVKAGNEAKARLKEGKYEKPEYRVYQGSDTKAPFREITKTEYDYAQELKAQREAAQQAEAAPEPATKQGLNQPETQASQAPAATENVAISSNGQDEKAIRYELPPEKYAQQQGDESWMAAQSPSFKPTARQQLLMDAVAKALDDGAFYNSDVDEHVAKALGVTLEQRARNSRGVEGGDFGFDVYNASRAVEAQRSNAKSREFAKALNLKPGDVLGTLVFNDGKVTTGVKVSGLNDSGLVVTVTGKRGAATLNGEVGIDRLAAAMDRAKERGKRKDGYAEFVAGRGAVQPSPQDFIPAPDGGVDYGEITPEMGKAMRRQAGKIRLRRGDETQGLVHIENRHAKDFAALGFNSTQDFVSQVASGFTKIYKGRGSALDVVLDDQARGMLIVSLEPSADGDFYDIKTATPIRRDQFKNEEPLWDRAGPSASTADEGSPPYPKGQNGVDSVPPTAQAAQPITRADVEQARQQAAAIITERIDAMTAGEVNTIARRFLPTMGVRPTVSKERNKAAVTDFTKVNPMAAADEFGATLPADVRRVLQADMEGTAADGLAAAKQEPGKPIEDAGEKIGGARKDRWKERGLNLDDLDAMTEAEGAELATKANVWKPDYEAMSEASEPVTAAMVKTIYDQLAAKPKKNTPEGRRQYVQMMRIVRDVLTEAKGPDAVRNAYLEIRKRAGLNSALPAEKSAGRELLFSVYKGRSDPFVFGFNELQRAKKLVEDGFPAKAAPWKSRLSVGRREGGNGTTERGIEMYMELSAEVGTPLTREQIDAGFFRVVDKKNKAVAFAATKEDAEAAAATVYERDMKGKKDGKPEPVRPNLDELKRENLPKRIERDVKADDFVNDLGFRGIEFGNWSAQDERQRILNMAYDGLMDLAEIMGVPPKAMSLNGTLGMAFGARGGGRFAAHYEPGKLVINMTKIRGGGSMAHEWAHAMDHYFGELDKSDAYTTQARGASGWYSEDQYLGVPRKRMERVGNEWKNVEKMRLDNLRPEMAAAFDEVMRALFQKQVTKAEMVRSQELDLERTESLVQQEQDAEMKAMYQRMATNKQQALNELRGDPDGTMYAGRGRSDYASQAQALSGKSVDGYWVRPTEMFARAFESWVFDRVTAMGAKSDYLVHGVEEDRFAGGNYKGNPYPSGEERARINAAFDKLASTIQTKETDKGVAMFSSADAALPAKPLSLDRVNQLVQEAMSGIRGAPPVEVTARPADIGLRVPAGSVGYGVTLRSGDIYVFQSAMGSDLDVFRTVFHELFHRGVRVLVPKAKYVQTMLDLAKGDSRIQQLAIEWKNTEMGQKQKDNLRQQGYTGAELTGQYEALAVEEALAAVAEEIKAEGKLGSKPKSMTIRFLANWLAKVADMAGMKKLAQGIRAMTYNQAERFVMSAIDRSGEPVQAGRTDNLSAKQAAQAGDQTQTEAFKRWFAGSRVVDADGKPLVVHHGTAADIDAFDLAKSGSLTRARSADGAFWFSDSPELAGDYAALSKKKLGKNGARNVMPVFLKMENPKIVDMAGKSYHELAVDFGAMVQTARNGVRSGTDWVVPPHDGMILRNFSDTPSGRRLVATHYVAFRPEQIKSAIGNNGNFDPDTADIRFRSADLGSRATAAANAAGAAIKSVTVANIKQKAGFKLTDYLGVGLQALGRRQIVDIYGDTLPLAEYTKLVTQMEADKNEGGAEADHLVTRWAKLPDEAKLADLMHDATLAQIDPAKPYVGGDDKARYMTLQGRFNALSAEAKQVYTDTRDAYQAHHAKVRNTIKERIERSELKGARKAELLQQMDSEFFAAVKGVYFPLARFGQYAVTIKGPDGKVESVSRAETKAEAEALRNNLLSAFPRNKGFTVGRVMLSKDFIADRDAVGRGFMTELYQVLDKQDMDAVQRAELEDTLGQLYLSSLPDLSWAKHGIHRKGTPGFSQDARRAYAQNMFHGSRYLAKLRYSDLMQDELTAMQKHVDDWREVEDFDQNKAQRVVDEMNKRHESLMNPKSSPLSTALTSFGFIFHLGLSPASALVNLSQTALVAYPIMGAKWGFNKASAALLKASADAAKGKNDITGSLNADERAAYDEAVRAGTIDVTMAHDLAGIAQGEDAGVMWKMRPVMRWASFLFHHAERFNRQVTFVASYRLARDTGISHKAAFEQATKATYDGHFDYGAANRPRVMQGNAAKVLLLFKQYGQNMVYTLSRNAYQSIKGTDAEKAEARKVLAGLLTSHAMAAGVLGLPMVTTLLAAASMIGGDDDEPWDAKVALQNMLADTFGQKPAEVLAHGLSRLTPWDISGRVGLDRLIFPDVQEGLEGQRLWESAATQALGPVGGIFGGALKGLDLISDGHYLLGLEAMLPAVLRQGVKSIRYGMDGAQDKGGVVIKDEVSLAGVAGQLLGFSPSEVRLAQEGKSAIYQHDKALTGRREELLSKAARATRLKDAEARAEAMKEIERFNQKNPKLRITPLNVLQSVRNSQKRIDQAEGGVYLPKNRRDAMGAGRFAVVDSE